MPRGGVRKGAGKKPGSPQASPLRFDLLETLRAKGFDPAAALLECHLAAMEQHRQRAQYLGKGGATYLQIATQSAEDLMSYIYPKRKSVELSGADGADLFQSFTDLVREIAKGEK